MTADPGRPVLHITPPRGWLNDPNGLVRWHGAHHVFHQADPASLWFGTTTWGHLSSTDLLHWTRHEAALVPSQPADRDGCWSGCIIDVEGTATAVYTGVVALGDDHWTQTVCLATSTAPDLSSWQKYPGNPVAVEPPPFAVAAFRDPYVWRDADGWVMLLGSSLPTGDGAILAYRSADLLHWTYVGIAVHGAELPGGLWTGAVWECPAIIPAGGGRHLLLFSVNDPARTPVLNYAVAVTGWFDGSRFKPDQVARFDHGHDCYAPALEAAGDGRYLAYGWSWEGLTEEGRRQQGWAGCLTLPREICTRAGQVTYRLGADLTGLRSRHWGAADLTLAAGIPGIEHAIRSRAAEIRLTICLDAADGLDLIVCASPDGEEQTVIRYRAAESLLEFDRESSSTWPEALGGVSSAHYALPADGTLDLTLILDYTVAELFVGDSIVMTERIYPQRPDSNRLRCAAVGGNLTITRIDVWELDAP